MATYFAIATLNGMETAPIKESFGGVIPALCVFEDDAHAKGEAFVCGASRAVPDGEVAGAVVIGIADRFGDESFLPLSGTNWCIKRNHPDGQFFAWSIYCGEK